MFLIREAVGSRIYLHEVWRWFMWGLLNAATAPIKSAANQFARNQLAAAMRKSGLNTVRAYRRSPVGSAEELAAARKLTANVPALRGLAAGSGGLTAIGVSNLTGFTGQLEGALNQVGPAVDRFFGRITPQAIQQFGREQEKKGWGGALEVAIPGTGFLAAPFIPNTQPSSKPSGTRPVGTQAVLNGKPVYWGGDNYGWQQLNQTGSSATLSSLNTPGAQGRFIQEQGFRPLGGTPEERAQAAETSRIAQLTAQDPELQRYEDARLKAVAPGATPEQVQSAEDIGMQMWAKANQTLAAKVKPGQSGYDAIQGTLAGEAARAGYGYQMPQQITFTPPPGINVPQGLPSVQSIGPSSAYGTQGIEVDPEMAKKFQALLNQAKQ